MSLTARVASIHDLKDGEMKEVKIGDKGALLARVNGHYFATGLLCTHLKGNLSKGTLTEEIVDKKSVCRVVCPLHGASFNLGTGDIEDAPALDAIPVFQVKIEGEDIFVTANGTELAESKRKPEKFIWPEKRDPRVFVVIGGGAAGLTAIQTLREEKFTGKIILISRENHLPIYRVQLSKSVNVELEKILLKPQSFFDELEIETHLGKSVTSVDPKEKKVTFDSKSLSYDSLLICTGSDPTFYWGDENKNLSNVFQLRTLEDSQKISKATLDGDIVLIGSSFIGMELACILVEKARSVTVVGTGKVPFGKVLGDKIGHVMQKLHESKNVKFKLGVVVEQFEKSDGKCTAIILKNGEKIPCDFVVAATGVSSATEFLKGTFKLEKDGCILVEKTMKVKEFDNIFAAGDIAKFPYHLNNDEPVSIGHWSLAEQLGRVAARNMLGTFNEYTATPYFWTVQYGKSLRYVGHATHFDDVIIQGSLDDQAFVGYYEEKNKIAAVCSLGKDPACTNSSVLMKWHQFPTVEEIRAGKSVLGSTFVSTRTN